MRPVTPRGFRDVLHEEAAERSALVAVMGEALSGWGYRPVETPVVEEYATLEAGAGGSLEGTAFRLFDADGRLLALRPEMTVPIARLVASRLAGEAGPHRIRYAADVFREHESLRGQARQFTQVGTELIGASGPAADAEVVAVLVDALEAAGLPDFEVAIGSVAVLRALLDAAGADGTWRGAVLAAAHERNLVEIDRLSRAGCPDPDVARALREVPRLRGGRDALDACRVLVRACGAAEAVDGLAEVWRVLETMGTTDRVAVDLSVMRDFDYYTGLVVEAYAPGFGLPLGGGGRYDGVLARFGTPAPAAGFALGLERVHIALAEQGAVLTGEGLDSAVGGPDAGVVLAAVRGLRREGKRAVAAPGVDRAGVAREASRLGAREAVWVAEGRLEPLGPDGGRR